MTSASDENWRSFKCFRSKEQVVVRQGQIRRTGWVIKTLEAQVGQFLLGCKCPVHRGIVVQEQDHLGDLPAAFFLQNVLQLHQQRWVIIRFDSLALWTIINEEDSVLIPKIEMRSFPANICNRILFGSGLSCYAATQLIVVLSPVHSDITKFRSWSAFATGNHLDCVEKIPNVVQTTGNVDVFNPLSGISGPI